MIYCDTSFLFSLYIEDSSSSRASAQIAAATESLVWTPWHLLEFTTALEARIARKANSRKEANAVNAALQTHLNQRGIFTKRTMNWDHALVRSLELTKKWGARFGCRSLDVLHVGICLEMEIVKFWSLDDRQRSLAKAVGLKINKT